MADDLHLDDDLRARAAELRREWRADEEEWSRAALEHFRHGRALIDVLREVMHRGDVVVLGDGPGAPRGVVVHVGEDWCRLDATGGVVELPVTASGPVVRVVERSSHGGCGGDPAVPSRWRARLLELEVTARPCVVELTTGEKLIGAVLLGGDHVVVAAGGDETYVPMGSLARLRPSCD